MSSLDDTAQAGDDEQARSARLAALEQQVAVLRTELASLRSEIRGDARAPGDPVIDAPQAPRSSAALAAALRVPPPAQGASAQHRATLSERMSAGGAISGVEIESLVGRYATLALAALVILMAVGALIKMAVERGLLTPEVRVTAGVCVAITLAGAGFVFRHRGDVRYGGVLLALALAVIDLVAWGAGPTFHLVSTHVALSVVDVAAVALAALAIHDGSEFLFAVAVGGALSAPFVTADGAGTAPQLLLYGGVVLAGALRAARNPAWSLAFALLVLGALVYSLAAAALPMSTSWYGPYLVTLFGGACATAALLVGELGWRSELPRAYLWVALIGIVVGWDAMAERQFAERIGVAGMLAVITYASLFERKARARYWTVSALVLPLVSLGVAYTGVRDGSVEAALFAAWTVIALAASMVDRNADDTWRGGTHLLTAAVLGCCGVTAWLWGIPLEFVAGLAAWSIVIAAIARSGRSVIPVAGVIVAAGGASVSAIDQLASRAFYSYAPFATRSSASALCAAIGIGVAGELLGRGERATASVATRPVRLGVLIGYLIVWGRMEMAGAYNRDLASFLLTSYYAGCGVGSIIMGRMLGIGRLRVLGLGLALFAAFKAIVEVTDIGSVLLRVGAYAAVGVFLLGAGYLYRDRSGSGDVVAAV